MSSKPFNSAESRLSGGMGKRVQRKATGSPTHSEEQRSSGNSKREFARAQVGAVAILALGIATLAAAQQTPNHAVAPDQPVRFAAVDVYVDSGEEALAAYQFELTAEEGDLKIVGIEGGEHPAFEDPPYYDPEALSQNRVIIAAFNTGDDLPIGRTRVARVHVQIEGNQAPDYIVKLDVAASADGEPIEAAATAEPTEQGEES